MSAGDITRLNRMYNCPIDDSSIALNRIAKSLSQFPNGVTIERMELNKTTNEADDPQMEDKSGKNEMELNSNVILPSDEDDMILSQEQIDALFSLNAAKRNGLKNAFHHWPMGIVAFEIDPTFSKSFTAFCVHSFSAFSLGFNTSRREIVKWRRQRGIRDSRRNSIFFFSQILNSFRPSTQPWITSRTYHAFSSLRGLLTTKIMFTSPRARAAARKSE